MMQSRSNTWKGTPFESLHELILRLYFLVNDKDHSQPALCKMVERDLEDTPSARQYDWLA